MISIPNMMNKDLQFYPYMNYLELVISGDKSDNIKRFDKSVKTIEDYNNYQDYDKKLFYDKMFDLKISLKLHKTLFQYYLGKKYLIKFGNNLQLGKVINRPSKINKSPYLADVYLEDEKKEEMVHTPSLGMCGYISPGATILVSKIKEDPKLKRKTKYNVIAAKAIEKEIPSPGYVWIGANPLLANQLFRIMLDNNLVTNISPIKYLDIKPEFKLNSKRIDFYIYDKLLNQKIFVEVKHLPIVDFSDPSPKGKIKSFNSNDYKRCSVFPDVSSGHKKDGCISIRAYQHLDELEQVVKLGHRGILIMMALRNDTYGFYPNYISDKKYTNKFYQVYKNGVEIQGYKFNYNTKGVRFGGSIPLIPFDKFP
jgi:DNA-binding sugar fermentation-stimulating protein